MGHEGNDKEIGHGGITPYILNLSTGWIWMFSFMH